MRIVAQAEGEIAVLANLRIHGISP